MEPLHTHRNFNSVKPRGFTTKRANQKNDSDYSFVSERREKTRSSGFTLVELLVVLAIIVVITGVVLSSQSSFNKTLILANTTYDVALSLRSAETYGLSSRVTTSGASNAGYGLHFVSGASTFTLFADTSPAGSSGTLNCPSASVGTPNCKPGDNVYTSGGDILVQTYTLGNGIKVSALNVTGIGNGSASSLDVVFSRPNSDAFMSADGAYSVSISAACITLSSPQGGSKFVRVEKSGSITANATSCL